NFCGDASRWEHIPPYSTQLMLFESSNTKRRTFKLPERSVQKSQSRKQCGVRVGVQTMSNSTEQPTGTEGPLRYAPRRTRDDVKATSPLAMPTKGSALRAEAEGEAEAEDVLRDRPFPLRDIRSPLVARLPPPPVEEERRSFGFMREVAILGLVALVAVACSVLV